jgi:hypothetical protein
MTLYWPRNALKSLAAAFAEAMCEEEQRTTLASAHHGLVRVHQELSPDNIDRRANVNNQTC